MYYSNSKVLLEEMPVPRVGKSDVLIKVMACGICGTDVLEWYRIKRAPLVLGHELAGQVVETGQDVKQFKKGDRVFSTHHVPCGACHYCLNDHQTACRTFQTINNHDPGGFSEYLRISGKSLETGTFVLPDEVSYEQGSFIEPLGTAVRGMRAAAIKPGDSLLILGSGIIGLILIKLARSLGAGRIIATDIHEARLKAAEKFGAEHTVNAKEDLPGFVKSVNNGRLADKVILCAGALSAANQAIESVDPGGLILFFAVPNPGEKVSIDFNPFWRNDVSIKTCYGAAPLDNRQAMELIRSKRVVVDDMITHRLGLAGIQEGFRSASEGKDCLKVIIDPWK
jgi:L-iditol 2-dehydrogenase